MISITTRELIKSSSLDKRSKGILLDRLSGKRLEEIGGRLGITRERVRQLANTAKSSPDLSAALPEINETLSRVCGRGEYSNNHKISERRKARRGLLKLMRRHFNRESVIGALVKQNPDLNLAPLTNEQICAYIHAEYNIKRYGDYLRCCKCDTVKSLDWFPPLVRKNYMHKKPIPSYCRTCSTARTRESYHRNPNVRAYYARYQRENKNRAAIHQMRHYYKKIGKAHFAPAIPKRGIPDEDIIVPRSGYTGWSAMWNSMTPQQKKDEIRKVALAMAAKRKQP